MFLCGLVFPDRYLVATQDQSLREKARRVPGTPVLYLHRSAPTLENPSEMSADVASHDASHRCEGSSRACSFLYTHCLVLQNGSFLPLSKSRSLEEEGVGDVRGDSDEQAEEEKNWTKSSLVSEEQEGQESIS